MLSWDSAKLETLIPEKAEIEISQDCTIITNMAKVLSSTTKLKVIELSKFIRDEKNQNQIIQQGCTLFFEHMPSKHFGGNKKQFIKNVDYMKQNFELEIYKEYILGNITYTFYKIENRKITS